MVLEPNQEPIPELSNESSSTIESLVEELKASRQFFNHQSTHMVDLTTGLQALTEDVW